MSKSFKSVVREALLGAIRALPFATLRRHRLMARHVRGPALGTGAKAPLRVLVLGVYMADRQHGASHLLHSLRSETGLEVEHRWASLNGVSADPDLAAATLLPNAKPQPKFSLLNALLRSDDVERNDYVVACDDDIFVPRGFMRAFLGYQRAFGFAMAQPSRAWQSHFDHAFVLRRPWLLARETRFVECGPFVCFERTAARLLLPFDGENQLWGMDLVWPAVLRDAGLRMGIVDAVTVDHSLRPQAVTYRKEDQRAAMRAFLAARSHLSFEEACTVVRRHWRGAARAVQSDA